MYVDERFLLLQVHPDPEIRAAEGKEISYERPVPGGLWSASDLVYKICPRRMPVLRFASEIPRAEEKPGVGSQSTRLVSMFL